MNSYKLALKLTNNLNTMKMNTNEDIKLSSASVPYFELWSGNPEPEHADPPKTNPLKSSLRNLTELPSPRWKLHLHN